MVGEPTFEVNVADDTRLAVLADDAVDADVDDAAPWLYHVGRDEVDNACGSGVAAESVAGQVTVTGGPRE